MSVQVIVAIAVSAFLAMSYVAPPAYCDDVQAQKKQVVSKALKIALEIEPLPNEIINLAHLLGSTAPEHYKSIEAIFEHVRDSAAHTQSAAEYSKASSAAIYLLSAVDKVDPKSAHDLFESWPAPTDFEEGYKDFKKNLEADKLRNRLIGRPMAYLNESIPCENTNAWVAVISQLEFSRPADARNAFEHFMSACEAQHGNVNALGHMLLPNVWDVSLFGRYFNLLKHAGGIGWSYDLSCNDQSVTLDYAEGEAFRVIASALQNHPELATKLLDAVSTLKEKTEQVGGLEAIGERGQLRGNAPYVNSPVLYKGYKALDAQLDTLCNQFSRNPDYLRQRLAELQSAERFEFLCRAALGQCSVVTDIASKLAREMTLNEPDPELRISMALKLLPYYFDNTRLDSKWINFGVEILRRAGARSASLNRSEFEDRLVQQLALVDFQRVISYIETAKDPLTRLQLFDAVMQFLDNKSVRAQQ